MNIYKTDPQLALTALEKIAEDIPSGVSTQDVGQIVTNIGCPQEITNDLCEKISAGLKTKINGFWTESDVVEKLNRVKDLKCDPQVTGEPFCEQLLLVAETKYLQFLKEALEVRINKVKCENASLENCVRTKAMLMEQQMKDIKACTFRL